MNNIWTIAKREYKLYFASPVAYLMTFFILLVVGAIFYFFGLERSALQSGYVPGVDIVLGPLATMLIFVTPAITTRLLAEEQRVGTIELLLTAPVRDWELVIGKWLGGFLLLLTIILITLIYPIILHQMVEPGIDQGPLITGYLGIILMSAALVAVGVFISSLFNNQIAAFVATLGVLIFLWWIITPIGQVLGSASAGAAFITYLGLQEHFFANLIIGILDLKDIAYYLSLTALSLFFGTMAVEIRRWG
ncbi:MAG TPA: ABC transporter permease [Anaerolineales bacterium]|nr:ABC transporter permease [Anaerolineales bacterium]